MDIELNEYVRLARNQGINKIIDKEDDRYILESEIANSHGDITWSLYECELEEEIVNHSKIISEIVEVGDYVNGKLIHKIDKGANYCYLYYGNCKTFVDYQIKTIITKEQIESIEYKVEEGK